MNRVTIKALKESRELVEKMNVTLMENGQCLVKGYKNQQRFWEDRKYKEMGDAILSCSETMLGSLRVLKNALNTLDELILQVEDYQGTRLSTGNGDVNRFTTGLREQTTVNEKENLNPELYRCGDVKVNEGALTMSLDYRNQIDQRIAKGTPKARQVYKTYGKNVVIQSSEYLGSPGYLTSEVENRGIYYDSSIDHNGDEFFTYFAKMMDDSRSPSYSSDFGFAQSLLQEGLNYRGSRLELLKIIRSRTDMPRNAFATFFQASMGNEALLAEIKENFPSSYQRFDGILENMIGHGERTR